MGLATHRQSKLLKSFLIQNDQMWCSYAKHLLGVVKLKQFERNLTLTIALQWIYMVGEVV
ncbi:hypothetical protein NC651_023808 [Populus alba x Populus x berolinensis]|nr:hypothetical protein NC651_023808 [Populus alba x Populus x berolinensis]